MYTKIKLAIFHPQGAISSELWTLVLPSTFLLLVHRCRGYKTQINRVYNMELSFRSCFPLSLGEQMRTGGTVAKHSGIPYTAIITNHV